MIRFKNVALQEILELELSLGNEIVETSINYPKEGSVFISLKKPFIKKHFYSEISFSIINDPHYWKEEYSDGEDLLVSKF